MGWDWSGGWVFRGGI